MALSLGDKVVYRGESINGEYLRGEIVIVAKNSRGFITSYFVHLDGRILVQFKPHNLNWQKLEGY